MHVHIPNESERMTQGLKCQRHRLVSLRGARTLLLQRWMSFPLALPSRSFLQKKNPCTLVNLTFLHAFICSLVISVDLGGVCSRMGRFSLLVVVAHSQEMTDTCQTCQTLWLVCCFCDKWLHSTKCNGSLRRHQGSWTDYLSHVLQSGNNDHFSKYDKKLFF